MDVIKYMNKLGVQARAASREMSRADSGKKNLALLEIAEALVNNKEILVAENSKDLAAGKKNGLDSALLDRLELTPAGIDAMVEGLHQVAALADPIPKLIIQLSLFHR